MDHFELAEQKWKESRAYVRSEAVRDAGRAGLLVMLAYAVIPLLEEVCPSVVIFVCH